MLPVTGMQYLGDNESNMSEATSIEFAQHGKTGGVEITPKTIGLSQFNEYNRQVEEFIGGSQRLKLNEVQVEVFQGSYVLCARIPAVVMDSLEPDLILMARQDSLGEIDRRRAEILQKWQQRAKHDPDLSYEIRPKREGLPTIKVSRETDFREGEIVPWVAVEKYLYGQVVDMGGVSKANIHLKPEGSGKKLVIGTSQDYLQEQEENRLYHNALLRVRAEQHYRSGELRNIQLISFEDYQPVYSEEALERFVAEGTKAWADVPDAAQWVREVRGG